MSDPKTDSQTVAVIGGGLGGVILAIGLLHRGIPIHIYQAGKGFAEIGAGVSIGPNAVRALRLNTPHLLEAFNKHVTCNADAPTSFLAFRRGIPSPDHDQDDDLYFDLTNEETAPNWTASPARMAVHRARFLDEIVKLIPADSVSFSKSLVDIVETDNSVTLSFADGTSASCGAVIGCDGVRSATRRYVHGPDAGPTFSGEYAYRALVPSDVFQTVMGAERTMNGQLYIGHGATVVTYPVEHGASINMVGIRTKPGSEWTHPSWLMPTTLQDLEADFAGWDKRLLDMLAKYGTNSKWALFHYMHDKPYYKGRVCLLGDSAHATTPNLGAGAGQAMEDAHVLAGLLGARPPKTGKDIEAVFKAYDAVRRPRSQESIRLSGLCGRTYSFQEDGVGDDFGKMKSVLADRLRWLLDEDLEVHFEKAKRLLLKEGGEVVGETGVAKVQEVQKSGKGIALGFWRAGLRRLSKLLSRRET
ncbi:salicylate 1-hydroxylase-like protein [Podospora didyma]|uniref:Salicylate 1-hydroxylase-like protein n=1 Tax=Podospora didyma TaxID=330526 RepID=A0AAE0NY90_9PEZI|nr:salicylate 1-hydroxylase-like protein [Podospora didyma]